MHADLKKKSSGGVGVGGQCPSDNCVCGGGEGLFPVNLLCWLNGNMRVKIRNKRKKENSYAYLTQNKRYSIIKLICKSKVNEFHVQT